MGTCPNLVENIFEVTLNGEKQQYSTLIIYMATVTTHLDYSMSLYKAALSFLSLASLARHKVSSASAGAE